MKSIFALVVLAITVVALPMPIEVEDVPGKRIHLKRNPGPQQIEGISNTDTGSSSGVFGSIGKLTGVLPVSLGEVTAGLRKRSSPSPGGIPGSLGGAGEILNEAAGSVNTLNTVTGTLNSVNNPHKRQSSASLNGIAGSLVGVVRTLSTVSEVLNGLIGSLGGATAGLAKRSSPSPEEIAGSLGGAGEIVNEVAGSVNTLNGVTKTANSINHPQKRQSPASLNGIVGSLGEVLQTLGAASAVLNEVIESLGAVGLRKRSSLSPEGSAGSFGGASETLNEVVGSMEFTDLDGVTGTANSINNPHKRSPGLNGVEGENLENELENKIKIGALGNTIL